jgi:hypothetical protein
MTLPIMSEVPREARVSGNSRGRSIFLNKRSWRPGRSAGQVPLLMLSSKEQDIQEILVRCYLPAKGTSVRAGGIPDYDRIRKINSPINLRQVIFFLTVRYTRNPSVVQDMDPERKSRPRAGFSHRECETGYTLRHTAAPNSRSVKTITGDLSCADE